MNVKKCILYIALKITNPALTFKIIHSTTSHIKDTSEDAADNPEVEGDTIKLPQDVYRKLIV